MSTVELTRLRRLFQATPNMSECPTCGHWDQPVAGSGATLYPCARKDHCSRECLTCGQLVCGEWDVMRCRKTSAAEYLAFLKAVASGGAFQNCCVCGHVYHCDDTLWCAGHAGRVCRACMPEFWVTACAMCHESFCSLCVADDMKTCPGTDCHHQLCPDCQEDDGRCVVCTEASEPLGKKSKTE